MLLIRQKSFFGRAPPGPAEGAYIAPPDPLAGSWENGGERGDGRAGGTRKGRKGQKEEGNGRKVKEREGIPSEWNLGYCPANIVTAESVKRSWIMGQMDQQIWTGHVGHVLLPTTESVRLQV